MMKVKHLMDAVEEDDGARLWVEAVGLTRDLKEWCQIDHVLSHLGPPKELWEWFQEHPDGYEFFRAQYHEYLAECVYKPALLGLASASSRETFTLVHGSDHPEHNSAMALYEFLSELSAYSNPDVP